MLRHILTLFKRNSTRHPATFIINLVGLSSALACTLLIYLWIRDEYSFDKFHKNEQRLFQILEREKAADEVVIKTGTPEFLVNALKSEMHEIETADVSTPSNFFPKFTISDSVKHLQGIGKFSGEDFFKVFSYHFVQGNLATALKLKNSIVLSQSLAKSLFGEETNVVGKSLQWNMQNIIRDVQVTGVFTDVPDNASEHFDFVLSMEAFKEIMNIDNSIHWQNGGPFLSTIVLKEENDLQEFESKLSQILASKEQPNRSLFIRKYADNYLYDHYENGVQSGGRITSLRLFALLGIIILIVAAINFMNLMTARASMRMKEIGIKKAIGAPRRALMIQYFSEAMITSILALCFGVIIVLLILPEFNKICGKHLELNFNGNIILGILSITLLTGLLAGTYPAIYLSGFKPVSVMKGLITNSFAERFIRKGLVMFQFSITAVLIISVLVVYRQMNFMSSKSLGYDKDNVIYFESSGNAARDPEGLLNKLKLLPEVVNASSMVGTIIGGNGTVEMNGGDGIEINGKRVRLQNATVNFDLLETLSMKLIHGRSFSREKDVDTMKVILNRSAMEAMGLIDPIGKRIPDYNAEIVGVVENFNYQSLHMPVKPFVFLLSPHYAMTFLVRIRPGQERESVAEIKKAFEQFNPGYICEYGFLDEAYEAQYNSESRLQMLAAWLTGLAIIISCLGLLSLAQFTASRKTREISIRKILGSSQWGIVYLLSTDFTKIILASIVVALPAGYYTSVTWLDSFAFRIKLEWWYFAFAGGVILLIAWMAIGTQVLKAARTNPVEGIK